MSTVALTITPGAGVTLHAVERSVDEGPFAPLVSFNMPMVTYTDRDVMAGHKYNYRVISYQGTVASAPSAPCTVSLAVNPSTISCVVAP